jgi:heme oxygenase (mycobilin-producing)
MAFQEEATMRTNSDGVVLINPFEVPPDRDRDFVSRWEQARDFLRERDGYVDTALHRSVAPDAEFRFVNVARWRSPEDFQAAMGAPKFPGRQMPYTSHPSLYHVVAEDDAPAGPDPAGSDPAGREPAEAVLLINLFEVPPPDDDDFLSSWEQARQLMRARPGYLGTRLHQSLVPDAVFRFVNIAAWPSASAFQAAIDDPAFRTATAEIAGRAHPSLYEVVRR